MANEFTPGPWEYEEDGRFGLVGADGRDGAGWIICDLSVHVDLLCNSPDHMAPAILAEVEANGRLIAAAPELVEALSLYIVACGNTAASVDRDLVQLAYAKATAAIAKATGNQSALSGECAK